MHKNRIRTLVRRELIFLALGTMEVAIIAPLLAAGLYLMLPFFVIYQGYLTILCWWAVIGTHYLARAILAVSWPPAARFAFLAMGVLLTGLLTVHAVLHPQVALTDPTWLAAVWGEVRYYEGMTPDLFVFSTVALLWWRGLLLAQRRLESGVIISRFRSGLLMLALSTVAVGFVLPALPYFSIFLYFFVSLMGIGLARAEEAVHQYGGSRSPFGVRWLTLLALFCLLILGLSAGVATILTGENVLFFLEPLLDVQRLLWTVVVYVLLWVSYWVALAIYSIMGDRWRWQSFEITLSPPPPLPANPVTAGTSSVLAHMEWLRTMGGMLIILLIVVAVALSLRRLRLRIRRSEEEWRESVWEDVDLRKGMQTLLAEGRKRLSEVAATLSQVSIRYWLKEPTIRRIYALVVALAAERGYPRADHQTPYEYLPTLTQAFPGCDVEVTQITEAYVSVHYGEMVEQPDALRAVWLAWQRIRSTFDITRPE